MDKRKHGYPNKAFEGSADDLIIKGHPHHHRIPHIQTKVVDTVAYSVRRPALVIRGGCKKYGNTLVLHNLNMFAKEGTIYCLVGASNTGKSTILSCIAGLRRLTKGEVYVFGATPGSIASGIPGRRVGYCPQELGLNTELTIEEALQYHGRLYGLTLEQIKDRTGTLANLLDLQHLTTRLHNLSPGLQKRTSLACSLVHEPEIIVLDQPTTGMDILFQKGIWMHLQKLVSNGRTSVIITSQNIEESRQAHRVGVLRSGRLLVEDSPLNLLQKHGTHLLAEAIAKLSVKDTIRIKQEDKENSKKGGKGGAEIVCMDEWTTFGIPSGVSIEDTSANGNVVSSVSYQEWMEQVVHGDEDQIKLNNTKKSNQKKSLLSSKNSTSKNDLPPYPNPSRVSHRLKALFIKQFLIMAKNFWFVLISLLIPAVLISTFCYTIGPQFRNLKFGLVIEEGEKMSFESCMIMPGCINEQLGCRFLEYLPKDIVELKEFENEDEALSNVEEGRLWGYLLLNDKFSTETFERATSSVSSYNDSSVKVIIDTSNVYVNNVLQNTIRSGFEKFETELALDCNTDPIDRNLSISFESLMSENESASYQEFFVPPAMFVIAYFTTLFTSGLFYLKEKRDGLISRSMVAAVNSAEILFTHLIYQLPILFAQIAILILIPVFIFNVKINGFWLWAAILVGLGGFSGLSLSFLLSTIFNDVKCIVLPSIGCLLASFMLSGVIWPVNSQYWIVEWGSYVLPWTLPSDAMRSIMVRGWEIDHPKVWHGFVAISAWTIAYWIISIIIISIRYFKR